MRRQPDPDYVRLPVRTEYTRRRHEPIPMWWLVLGLGLLALLLMSEAAGWIAG